MTLAEAAWAGWPTAEQWSAVWAFVTAAIAGAAAVLAFRQLSHAREAAREQSRPYVVVSVVPSEASSKMLDLRVENLGLTAAYEVATAIDPPFERSNPVPGYPFMGAGFLQRPIPSMAPRFARTVFMDTVSDRHEQDDLMLFTATVNYRDASGHRYEDRFELDLDIWAQSLHVDVHGLHHIARTLRAVAEKMGVHSF